MWIFVIKKFLRKCRWGGQKLCDSMISCIMMTVKEGYPSLLQMNKWCEIMWIAQYIIYIYSYLQDVFIRVIKNEGFFSLWKGFTPYYARLGPHTVLTFIFLEQMNQYYKVYILGDMTSGGGGL